jgi:ribosomal protein S18 acetylase RimI-like enzyme
MRIGEDRRMAIELRTANPEDADAIAALFGAARRATMAYLPQLHTAEEHRAFFAGVIADGHTTVALQNGHVVGFIALGEARVEHLYVEPAHQRRQIGTALLRHAQAARPAGLDLWVFQRNTAAIAFYERHGFRVAELTDGEDNEEREPDARMVWSGA